MALERVPAPYRPFSLFSTQLEPDVINCFKALSGDTRIPYRNLINMYLLDCAKEQRRLSLTWKKTNS